MIVMDVLGWMHRGAAVANGDGAFRTADQLAVCIRLVRELIEADHAFDVAERAVRDAQGHGHGRHFLAVNNPLLAELQRASRRRHEALAAIERPA